MILVNFFKSTQSVVKERASNEDLKVMAELLKAYGLNDYELSYLKKFTLDLNEYYKQLEGSSTSKDKKTLNEKIKLENNYAAIEILNRIETQFANKVQWLGIENLINPIAKKHWQQLIKLNKAGREKLLKENLLQVKLQYIDLLNKHQDIYVTQLQAMRPGLSYCGIDIEGSAKGSLEERCNKTRKIINEVREKIIKIDQTISDLALDLAEGIGFQELLMELQRSESKKRKEETTTLLISAERSPRNSGSTSSSDLLTPNSSLSPISSRGSFYGSLLRNESNGNMVNSEETNTAEKLTQ